MANAVCRPGSLEALCAAVREHPLVQPRGGGTKPALSTPRENALGIDMTGLAGIVEYEPGEFTFTALAGTPVAEVQRRWPSTASTCRSIRLWQRAARRWAARSPRG